MKLKDMFQNTAGNSASESPKLRRKLAENEQWLQAAFSRCHDVKLQKMEYGAKPQTVLVMFVYCEGMIDAKQLNETVLPSLHHFFSHHQTPLSDERELLLHWQFSPLTTTTQLNEVLTNVLSGQLAVIFDGLDSAFMLDIAHPPQRKPEESRMEMSVRGPRDSFTEELSVNVALLRKRLTTTSFCFEQFFIGKRTKTKVGLLYIHDIIRPTILQEARERLTEIDVDVLFSSNQLQELLSRPMTSLFPLFQYTGRPDQVIASLMRGRFAILVEGNPTAIIAPANFSLLYKSPEDLHAPYFFATFGRLLRIVGLFISLFLPGLYVAITTFHQDQIPLTLLATLVVSRKGTPLPTPLEALLMLLLFELFHEAGLRLPSAIGQTLAVVGGLIIGDAAIRAGLTSPSMLVVIGTTAVATFTLVNQSLIGSISIFRIGILFASSLLGAMGFLLAVFTLLVYLSNLRSFGVSYLSPISPISFPDFLHVFARFPANKLHSARRK